MSGLQQHKSAGLTLPAGYVLRGYQILETLFTDDYSVTYLVSLSSDHSSDSKTDQNRLLVEYFPRAFVRRDQSSPAIIPRSEIYLDEFREGLKAFVENTHEYMGVSHPCIAGILSGFKDNNTAYRLVEYKPGVTLEQYAQEQDFDEKLLKSMLVKLLDGLQAIHAAGHIHGSLDPTSILVQHDEENPLITFSDHYDSVSKKAVANSVNISPGFSASEQYFTHSTQGPWTDIYAIGALLYLLISKVTPASSISRLMSVAEQQSDPLVPLSTLVYQDDLFSRQFLNAIDHALSIEAVDRPQSLTEWREELGIPIESEMHLCDELDQLPDKKQLSQHNPVDEDEITIITTPARSQSSDLVISGVTLPEASTRHDVDFHAISQIPEPVSRSRLKRFLPHVITASLLIIIFSSGVSMYLNSQDAYDEDFATDEDVITDALASTISSVSKDEDQAVPLSESMNEQLPAETSFIEDGFVDTQLVTEENTQQEESTKQVASVAATDFYLEYSGAVPVPSTGTVTTFWSVNDWQRPARKREVAVETDQPQNDQQQIALNQTRQEQHAPTPAPSRSREYYLAQWAAKHAKYNRNRNKKRNWSQSGRKNPGHKSRQQYQREWAQKQKLARQRAEWQRRQLQKKRQAQYRRKMETKAKVEQIEQSILSYSEF